MISPSKDVSQVYIYTESVDMRKQINGLAILVEQVLEINPMDGSLFVFCNNGEELNWLIDGFDLWNNLPH